MRTSTAVNAIPAHPSAITAQGTHRSRFVLLATGVKDHLPAIEGASEAILRSLIRFCPICDAFEAIDKRIAVISDGALGEREAAFLSHYSDRVTLLHVGQADSLSAERKQTLKGIERLVTECRDCGFLKISWC